MSSIGLTNIGVGGMNLAGSAAGTQRSGADTDSVKKNGADQKATVDRDAQSAQTLNDVAEAELSSDRDADGRQPFGLLSRPGPDEESEEESAKTLRTPDATGERGNALDLEA
ncbi:MAG: hypothetical protein HOL01_05485 [Planctomycetaceae bacterium]|jgi:hypothetical protein|nr:hypothetical protein [Planctomycetaceae bacterium]MBT6483954.1 hypothetical protein [Planctomycetaceae bacterium]MBT6493987.1 hypothetical protein [Planctomycetaceae bacterium]